MAESNGSNPIGPEDQKIYWNNKGVVNAWSDEMGGLPVGDVFIVESQLTKTGFYSGLQSDTETNLLEIGVGGYSYVNREYLPENSHLYGVDLSLGLLQKLREKDSQKYHALMVGNAKALPIAGDSMKRTLAPFVMRYLSPEDQLEAILEMVRVTKIGGTVEIIDYDKIVHQQEVSTFSPSQLQEALQNQSVQQRLADLGKSVSCHPADIVDSANNSKLLQLSLQVRKKSNR